MSIMEYRDYCGSAEFSQEDEVFHGKVLFVNALITYESETAKGLLGAFHEAVDDYLAWAEEDGFKPEKPFKGSFNVRIEPDLHRQAARYAKQNGLSLNAVVSGAIKNLVQGQSYV